MMQMWNVRKELVNDEMFMIGNGMKTGLESEVPGIGDESKG